MQENSLEKFSFVTHTGLNQVTIIFNDYLKFYRIPWWHDPPNRIFRWNLSAARMKFGVLTSLLTLIVGASSSRIQRWFGGIRTYVQNFLWSRKSGWNPTWIDCQKINASRVTKLLLIGPRNLWVRVSVSNSLMFCWLNWCVSGWWRYQLNSSWWY